jgi:hypothetical protein
MRLPWGATVLSSFPRWYQPVREQSNIMARDSDLTNLRRARIRCHKALKQAEELTEGYRAKLADLEARIQAIAPDLKLPARFHRPNPYLARGELRRLAIDMLREAGKPPAVREMALAALKAKGVRYPDRRTMRITRTRLRDTFARLEARGMARTVGTGKATRWMLIDR